jgi:hypothetical protein
MRLAFAHHRSFCCALPLVLVVCALAGCGSKSDGPKDSVYGKVTLNGQPVTGQVVFVGPDKKEVTSPITPEGEYRIVDPPKGEVVILVRSVGAAPAGPSPVGPGALPTPGVKGPGPLVSGGKPPPGPTPPPKGGKPPDMPSGMPTAGATPPAKYATAAGGLKLTVTGGDQKYDIELKP